MIIILCAVLVSVSGARAQSQTNPSDTLISLGPRVFALRERSPILDRQVENEIFPLTDVDWIKNLTWSDPLLTRTVIQIKDQTRMLSGRAPPWMPDNRARFHPDPTLPPIFDLDRYEVGWLGVNDAPVRGDLLIFLRHDPQRFYVLCDYDQANPRPTFCALTFRYGPDRNLQVTTRIYQVTSPLNDFAEIAARVEALVRCLDVTEALQAGEMSPAAPYLLIKDIAAGGRCRITPSS